MQESFICVLVCPQFFMDLISLYTTSLPRQLGMNFASWSQRMGWGNGRVPQSVRHGRNPAGRLGASFTARLKGPQLPELLDVMQTPRVIKHGFPEMKDETDLIQLISWHTHFMTRYVHEAYYCTMQTCIFSNTHTYIIYIIIHMIHYDDTVYALYTIFGRPYSWWLASRFEPGSGEVPSNLTAVEFVEF